MSSSTRQYYKDRRLDPLAKWFDIKEFAEEEEDEQRRLEYQNIAKSAATEARIQLWDAEELEAKWLKYDAFIARGFKESTSVLWSFGRGVMPPKRKMTGPVNPRTPKAAKNAKKYPVKATDKYGYHASNEQAMLKALVAAESARQINKNIETQHSYCLVNLNSNGNAQASSGFSLVGLNQTYNPATATAPSTLVPTWNNMLVFNLSALCQVRAADSATVLGYRTGNKVNVLSLNITVNGGVHAVSTGCSYKMMIARRKDGALVGAATTPELVASSSTGLWKSQDEGPYALKNTGSGVQCPISTYCSTMRRNYDSWQFPSNAFASCDIDVPGDGPGPTTEDSDYTAKLNMNLYHSFGEVWDYPNATSSGTLTVKGGDYFFYLWREGPEDTVGEVNLNVHFSLSFKDG